jgi:hypothetical protein
MIRALAGWLLSALAYRLALMADALLRPTRPAPAVQTSAPPAALAPDRYVHELASLPLAKADGVLSYVLGGSVLYLEGTFTKFPDKRWRQ